MLNNSSIVKRQKLDEASGPLSGGLYSWLGDVKAFSPPVVRRMRTKTTPSESFVSSNAPLRKKRAEEGSLES